MPNLTTIEYDQPVQNLIAGLNATGHITHGPYKKTGVTFHHNGGIFTHQEILNIWKTRPASAHFDVDADGAVAQFANAYDYAWACANTQGNESTISIEMCNATLAPKWLVSETTWRSAARLAGWLFAHIIDAEPTEHNIYFHHDWYPTACAGPYMDSVRPDLVDAVQHAYRGFKTGAPVSHPIGGAPVKPKPDPVKHHGPARLAEDGRFGIASIKAWQQLAGTTQDGVISSQPKTTQKYQHNLLNVRYVTHAKGSQVIAWVQQRTGARVDGLYGPASIRATQKHVHVTQDSYFGPATAAAVQHAINEGTF